MNYRVIAETSDGRQLLRHDFADRISAESYQEQLRPLTSTPTRVQVQTDDGQWVNCQGEPS